MGQSVKARCENCEDQYEMDYYCTGGEHFCCEWNDGGECGKPAKFRMSYEFNDELWYFWVCADCYDKYYADDLEGSTNIGSID